MCKEYAQSLAFANIRSPKAKIRIQALETLQFMAPLSMKNPFGCSCLKLLVAPVQELATQNGITEMLIRLKISEVRNLIVCAKQIFQEADDKVKEIAESILKRMIH